MALDYAISKVESITLVTLQGAIVAGEPVDQLVSKTTELLDAGERNLILDLAAVKFVDSTGIGALIELVAAASRKQGSLKLLNLTKRIHDVIQITRLSSVFEIFDDLQKAVASFVPDHQETRPIEPVVEEPEEVVPARRRLKTAAYSDEDEEERPDRRKVHRWNIPVPVRVKGRRPDGSEFEEETVTADACSVGMCLLLTVAVPEGGKVVVAAPEEKFESTATVVDLAPLGPHMNRVRVEFPSSTSFNRDAAEKKYIYDYSTDTWVAYITQGTYYDSRHQPFGKVVGQDIISIDRGEAMFRMRYDRLYDQRMNCIGHII